jgi:KDO2-lipid IV(A) lauroyltransferase
VQARLAEYCAARLLLASLAWTPRPIAENLARLYVRMLDFALPRLRRTAMRNLAMALPELEESQHRRIATGGFASIARLLVVLSRFPRLNRENISEWIHFEGEEHVEAARRAGRGILFATAHLGNWELSAIAYGLICEPMHVVVRPLDNPHIDALIARFRRSSGNHLIVKKDAARAIVRALKNNQAVGILIDQNSSLDEGVFIDFFGIKACANAAFARMAAATGAAVIPGFALWDAARRRYVLRFYPPVPITGDTCEDTRRIQGEVEAVIRQYPDQWLWMHRRWKTRPPGEPPLY